MNEREPYPSDIELIFAFLIDFGQEWRKPSKGETPVMTKKKPAQSDETFESVKPSLQLLMGKPVNAADYAGSFPELRTNTTIALTSYYEDGRGVTTPVWFVEVVDKVYVSTVSDTYKVQRIRSISDVEVTPSNMQGMPLGPTLKASARILGEDEAEKAAQAFKVFKKKYGFPYRFFSFFYRFSKTRYETIEIWRETA